MPNTDPESKSFIHVVAAIIRHPEDATKIFITRRKKGQHLQDMWEFPGGKVEKGEPPFHALRRELEEETGIFVKSAQPFKTIFHRYHDKSIKLEVWQLRAFYGQPHGRENQQSKWIALNDLDNYTFPDADKPILQALSLPAELLITPDVMPPHEESFLQQFERVMYSHPYKLVSFRSHQLEDKKYSEMALKMNKIAIEHKAQIVIHRAKLKSLKAKNLEPFTHRHLNSYQLQSLTSRPFDESMTLSASCHDLSELKLAERFECKYAFLSTVRETSSHPGRTAKGWYGFKQLAQKSRVPIYALGGVKRQDYYVASYQGAVGVAGISDFWSA